MERKFVILFAAALLLINLACSGTSGEGPEGPETGGDGEESGTPRDLGETFDMVRNGVRLVLRYDAANETFTGTATNTTPARVTQVRIEVHLSNGVELGPTAPVDLEPSQTVTVTLPATGQVFDTWVAHPEAGASEAVTPLTPQEIRTGVEAVYSQADSLLVSDVSIILGGLDTTAQTSCGGGRCTSNETTTGAFSERDLAAGVSAAAEFTAAGHRGGIPLTKVREPWEWDFVGSTGLSLDASGYGGWLQYSGFDVRVAEVPSGELQGLLIGAGSSWGRSSGSRPAASATWRGAMVGATYVNNRPETLMGDATVVYDLGRNQVDVSLFDIDNVDANQPFPDLGWSEVPVGGDGSFASAASDVEGRFYGPNHEEVGGVFTGTTATGSFGATR